MSALIVTAELGSADFAWLDPLRRKHFPPERNHLSAHLTMFHALPPSAEPEVRSRLIELSRGPAPKATITGLMDLGNGTAFRVASDDLESIRGILATDLHGLLSAQDSGGWSPHITIQNKVRRGDAIALQTALEREFTPRPLAIRGLALHRYLGGPWETLGTYRFRGVR